MLKIARTDQGMAASRSASSEDDVRAEAAELQVHGREVAAAAAAMWRPVADSPVKVIPVDERESVRAEPTEAGPKP